MLLFLLAVAGAVLPGGRASAFVSLPEGKFIEELHRRAQTGQNATAPLDTIIDFLLAGAVPQIVSKGRPAIAVPDVSFHFDSTFGPFKVAGGVEAGGGALQDFKSLYRKGATVLRRSGAGGALLLEAAAGIRALRLSYSKYRASLGGLHAAGSLQAAVSPAALQVQVALLPPCTAQLKLLQVAQLGPFHVQVTGLPAPLAALPQLLEGLLAHPAVRQAVEAFVVAHVQALLAHALKGLSC